MKILKLTIYAFLLVIGTAFASIAMAGSPGTNNGESTAYFLNDSSTASITVYFQECTIPTSGKPIYNCTGYGWEGVDPNKTGTFTVPSSGNNYQGVLVVNKVTGKNINAYGVYKVGECQVVNKPGAATTLVFSISGNTISCTPK